MQGHCLGLGGMLASANKTGKNVHIILVKRKQQVKANIKQNMQAQASLCECKPVLERILTKIFINENYDLSSSLLSV